jgi:hypothetical protein
METLVHFFQNQGLTEAAVANSEVGSRCNKRKGMSGARRMPRLKGIFATVQHQCGGAPLKKEQVWWLLELLRDVVVP